MEITERVENIENQEIFLSNFINKKVTHILTNDMLIKQICDIYGISVPKMSSNVQKFEHEFKDYIKTLNQIVVQKDYSSIFEEANKIVLPSLRYIKNLIKLNDIADKTQGYVLGTTKNKPIEFVRKLKDKNIEILNTLDEVKNHYEKLIIQDNVSNDDLNFIQNLLKTAMESDNFNLEIIENEYKNSLSEDKGKNHEINNEIQGKENYMEITNRIEEFKESEGILLADIIKRLHSIFMSDDRIKALCQDANLNIPMVENYGEDYWLYWEVFNGFRYGFEILVNGIIKYDRYSIFDDVKQKMGIVDMTNEMNFYKSLISIFKDVDVINRIVSKTKPKNFIPRAKEIVRENGKLMDKLISVTEYSKKRGLKENYLLDRLVDAFLEDKEYNLDKNDDSATKMIKIIIDITKSKMENDENFDIAFLEAEYNENLAKEQDLIAMQNAQNETITNNVQAQEKTPEEIEIENAQIAQTIYGEFIGNMHGLFVTHDETIKDFESFNTVPVADLSEDLYFKLLDLEGTNQFVAQEISDVETARIVVQKIQEIRDLIMNYTSVLNDCIDDYTIHNITEFFNQDLGSSFGTLKVRTSTNKKISPYEKISELKNKLQELLSKLKTVEEGSFESSLVKTEIYMLVRQIDEGIGLLKSISESAEQDRFSK